MTRAMLSPMSARIVVPRAKVERALRAGTLGRAAEELGLSRWTLRRLLGEHALVAPRGRGRPPGAPSEAGALVYAALQAGASIREAAAKLGLARTVAHRAGLAHASRAGLPWPPPPVNAPPSEGERCYRSRERGLSWDQVAREELAPLEGRTSPEHLAMTVAKRWAKASGASWPVQPPKS